jgi:hypothetical protein
MDGRPLSGTPIELCEDGSWPATHGFDALDHSETLATDGLGEPNR